MLPTRKLVRKATGSLGIQTNIIPGPRQPVLTLQLVTRVRNGSVIAFPTLIEDQEKAADGVGVGERLLEKPNWTQTVAGAFQQRQTVTR